jgi:hypothetical protein
VNGTLYQLGCIVSYKFIGVLPQFGELIDIASDTEFGVIFLLKVYETVCFQEHYHAYEIDSTEENIAVKPDCLLDYHPMVKHCCGKDMDLTVVCLKYDLL